MKRDDFPGAVEHGDAWTAFVEADLEVRQPPYAKQDRWRWFLHGWKAKGKQRALARLSDTVLREYQRDRKAGKYNNPLIKPEMKK